MFNLDFILVLSLFSVDMFAMKLFSVNFVISAKLCVGVRCLILSCWC